MKAAGFMGVGLALMQIEKQSCYRNASSFPRTRESRSQVRSGFLLSQE
jgi:hypothetical protein